MPDALFDDPRLAAVYDAFEGERDDLDPYLSILTELGAFTVIDLGCGTGSLARELVRAGFEVIGIDPARSSLEIAVAKVETDVPLFAVSWIRGTAEDIPRLAADALVMTGNVAQIFLSPDALEEAIAHCSRGLHEGGHLVFETRIPDARAWESWARRKQITREVAGVGEVTASFAVTEVALPLVSFVHTYAFPGETISSDSTLRFHSRTEVERALDRGGFDLLEIRDAPDRPGSEWVFIARKRSG